MKLKIAITISMPPKIKNNTLALSITASLAPNIAPTAVANAKNKPNLSLVNPCHFNETIRCCCRCADNSY